MPNIFSIPKGLLEMIRDGKGLFSDRKQALFMRRGAERKM